MSSIKRMAMFLALASAPVAFADVVVIDGTLSTTDFLAEEDYRPDYPLGSWTFYYDVYDITSSDGADISITMTSTDFVLWYGIWDEVVLPDPIWITLDDDSFIDKSLYEQSIEIGGNGGADPFVSTTIFNPIIGQIYQIAIATFDYLPTAMGDYQLEISSTSDITVTEVPEPGTLFLFGLGLAVLGWTRPRKRQPAR